MSALRYLPLGLLLAVAGAAVVACTAVFALVARHGGIRRAVVLTSRIALACVVLAVLAATLSSSGAGPGVNVVPGAGIAQQLRNVSTGLGVVNVAGNVLMFLPVGALALIVFHLRWWGATACGMALSVVVEAAQLVLGRSADVDDVLLNTAGAALGAGLAAVAAGVLARYLSRRRRGAGHDCGNSDTDSREGHEMATTRKQFPPRS